MGLLYQCLRELRERTRQFDDPGRWVEPEAVAMPAAEREHEPYGRAQAAAFQAEPAVPEQGGHPQEPEFPQ